MKKYSLGDKTYSFGDKAYSNLDEKRSICLIIKGFYTTNFTYISYIYLYVNPTLLRGVGLLNQLNNEVIW
jgi:hypothetical protein